MEQVGAESRVIVDERFERSIRCSLGVETADRARSDLERTVAQFLQKVVQVLVVSLYRRFRRLMHARLAHSPLFQFAANFAVTCFMSSGSGG